LSIADATPPLRVSVSGLEIVKAHPATGATVSPPASTTLKCE
jgi:hypothetical protein